jgi:HlyD family secretion protein
MDLQNLPDSARIEATLQLDSGSRRRRWVSRAAWIAVAALLVSAASWSYFTFTREQASVTYQTAEVSRADLVVTVQATGNVEPTTQVDVSSEMSGVVRLVNVKNNSMVKKGDVLAELDSVRLRAQIARVRASLAAAEAKLADARATLRERQLAYERAATLSRKGISSTQDAEGALASQARAEAAVTAAEADIEVVKAEELMQATDLGKTRIVSPVDGIVLKRSVEPGQTVASSLQAPVLFTLAEDLTRMQLEANVDEADIGSVKRGQKANFTVDAYPGRGFPATIDTIEFSPNVIDKVVTYTAVLTVDNSELLLRPGMTATAQIVVQEVKQVLTVPNAALRYAPPVTEDAGGFSITSIFMPRPPRFTPSKNNVPANGERSLWILDSGTPREVKVKTGATDGRATEIVAGELKVGDQVITAAKQAAN